MATIPVILMVLSVILLAFAAFKLMAEPAHIAFGWAGLFFWALVILIFRGQDLFK